MTLGNETQKKQDGAEHSNSQPALPGHEEQELKTSIKPGKANDADKLSRFFAFLAATGAVAAAVFTGLQWWIARDTEQRQLRAYVDLTDIEVVCPDCKNLSFQVPKSTDPVTYPVSDFIHIRFENVGQTPAEDIRSKINWWTEPRGNARLPLNFAFEDYPSLTQDTDKFVSASALGRDKHRDAMAPIVQDVPNFQAVGLGNATVFCTDTLIIAIFSASPERLYFVSFTPRTQESGSPFAIDTTGKLKLLTVATNMWNSGRR
jgi:hypothetical protein